ncbi:MAG TPA: right-handed parallel beta-helix repeat-containing protein, partial [Pirellulaceae bacterium]|nr:right-handed parallel beta-helix repeat-containing protein [Pirellulaceae bacterium]
SKDKNYTLLAYGGAGALRHVLLDDNDSAPDSGRTLLRVINAAPDNAVTVNSNDEVSGFTITNPVAAGIYANNVAGPVNINRNTIDGGVNGINITDSTGTFSVTQTTIKNTTGTAFNVDGGAPNITSSADITNNQGRLIAVTDTTGGTIKFEGGVLVDNGGDGILVQNSNSLLTITAATLNNSTGNAVDIVNSPGVTTLNNLVINSPTAAGIDILDSNAVVNGAKIDNTTTQGIVVTNLNNNRTVDLLGNTLTHIGSIGLELNIDGTGTLTSNVANNNVTSTGTGFDARTSLAGGDLTLKFDNNTLASTLGAGAIIDGTGPGDVTITSFLNNIVTSAGAGGILVTDAVFDANPLVAGFQTVSGGVSTIGSSGTRVTGDGLNLQDVQGGLSYTGLSIFNNQGTGLNVVGNSVFNFNVTTGSVDTTNGQALNAASTTLAATFTGLKSTNSPTNGIHLNGVAGTLTSSSTTVNNPTNDGVFVENSPGFTADFGATTITGTGVAGGAVGRGVVLQNNPGGTFTFGTLGVTTDNGAGFVAQNSGTVNLGAPASVTAVGGPAVFLDSTRGNTAGSPGWGFTTLSSTASTTQGLYLHDLDDPFNVSGTTTINGAALTSILIDGDTNATFAATNILNRGGAGIDLNNTTGAIAFGATTISGAGAGTPGVDYSDSTSGSLKFASLSVSGSGGPSVNLTNNAGAFEVTGATTINASQGVGIDVNGGTGGVTFGAVTMTNRFNTGIDINGGSQTVTFGATSIDNPNLSGTPAISITNVTGGSIALASATINNNNAVADGIRLVGNTAPVTVGGGSITGAAGSAVAIDGGSADVNIAATISNNQGRAVDIVGRAGGVVTFSGAINDAGAGTGIHITAPIAPNVVNFTAPVNLGTPANRLTGDTALLVDNGGFGPNQTVVKFANLNIYGDRKIGIDASNGGTLQIDAGTVNTTGTGATGVKLDGIESLITLSSLTVDNIGSTNPAVDLQNITGAFNVTGATTLGATGPIGRGVDIGGGNADITFAATTIKNRYAEGVNVDGTSGNIKFGATTINGPGDPSVAAIRVADTLNGAVVFDSVTVSGGTGEGLLLVNNAANFNVTGATVVSNNATVGVDVQGGSGNVTFNSLNLTNTSGTGLKSDGLTGLLSVASGTITNANGTAVNLNDTFMNINLTNVTATNGSALRVTGNSTGTLAVSGTTKVTNGLAESIYVSGGNTDVLLGAVNIANTAGVGLYVHDSTGLFQTTSGAVANTGGAAIDIANSTLNTTLTSVSSKGATTGLSLSNTAGTFTISGGGAPGTGGTIQNAFTGVLLANAPNVTINDLTVSAVLGNGFELNGGTTNATLSGVTVTSTGGSAIHADNVSTLNINNATVSTTSPGVAAVLIEDSSKV